MNKRIVVAVLAIFTLTALSVKAVGPSKRARIKGLVIPLDDELDCVYENCMEMRLGPGFVGKVRSSSQVGFVRLYPENSSDRALIKNRNYILIREDQILYL